MFRLWPFLFVVLIGTFGCNTHKVTPDDLAGTWVMKESSRQVLPVSVRNASAKIVLFREGRFTASEMPGLLYGDRGDVAKLDSGSGAWTVVAREGGQEIQLNFHAITGGNTQLPVPYGTQIMVSKLWSTSNMEYYVGDQDQGIRVEFEKK